MARNDKPSGVSEIKGQWYWRPGSKVERDKRKAEGLPAWVPLGPAGSREARMRWAEVTGRVDVPVEATGRVSEIIAAFRARGLKKKDNGQPRAPKTILEYDAALTVMDKRFGHMRYGKTAADVIGGRCLATHHISEYLSDDGRPIANRRVAALSAAFTWARRKTSLTTYNPCLGSGKNAEDGRDREVLEWEVEALHTVAEQLKMKWLHLVMRFEAVSGWRISDIRLLDIKRLTPNCIKVTQGKRGRKQDLYWSDELRDIIAEAKTLPGANVIAVGDNATRYVFPAPDGQPLTLDAFEKRWGRLMRRANQMLKDGDLAGAGLQITDLHFHDLRAKAGDDAEEQGQERDKFLGNSKAVADRHYARRAAKVYPVDPKRRA